MLLPPRKRRRRLLLPKRRCLSYHCRLLAHHFSLRSSNIAQAAEAAAKKAQEEAAAAQKKVCAACSAPCCRLTRSLQAAAVARIAGKDDVFQAARSGDTALVRDHIAADASCVNKRDFMCDPYPFTHAFIYYHFSISCFKIRNHFSLPSAGARPYTGPLLKATSTPAVCWWRPKLISLQTTMGVPTPSFMFHKS